MYSCRSRKNGGSIKGVFARSNIRTHSSAEGDTSTLYNLDMLLSHSARASPPPPPAHCCLARSAFSRAQSVGQSATRYSTTSNSCASSAGTLLTSIKQTHSLMSNLSLLIFALNHSTSFHIYNNNFVYGLVKKSILLIVSAVHYLLKH